MDIRNKAIHEGKDPDTAEAAYVVTQVKLILRETNRFPVIQPPRLPCPGCRPPSRIDSQPNLNHMLVTRIESVRQDRPAVHERIRQAERQP